MSGRRGFFAMVGGAAVTGLVTLRQSAARPMLIMPPAALIETPIPAGAYPLLAGHPSQMEALIHIKQMIPPDYFLDWLEGGLRTARMFNGRDEATMERLFSERDRPLSEGGWP